MVRVYDIETDQLVEVTQAHADFWMKLNMGIGLHLAPVLGNSTDPNVLEAWDKFKSFVHEALPNA